MQKIGEGSIAEGVERDGKQRGFAYTKTHRDPPLFSLTECATLLRSYKERAPMLAPNTIIAERYEVIQLLGQGGMGAVYEVLRRLQCHVALKQMLVQGDTFTRQFMREAQILARLHHPALPVVSDFFTTQGAQFLVMEYIAGPTFTEALTQRGIPFPVAEVLGWADELLDALGYLHQQTPPIIHRQLSAVPLAAFLDRHERWPSTNQ